LLRCGVIMCKQFKEVIQNVDIFFGRTNSFVIKMIMYFSCKSLRICRICTGDTALIMIHINGLKWFIYLYLIVMIYITYICHSICHITNKCYDLSFGIINKSTLLSTEKKSLRIWINPNKISKINFYSCVISFIHTAIICFQYVGKFVSH